MNEKIVEEIRDFAEKALDKDHQMYLYEAGDYQYYCIKVQYPKAVGVLVANVSVFDNVPIVQEEYRLSALVRNEDDNTVILINGNPFYWWHEEHKAVKEIITDSDYNLIISQQLRQTEEFTNWDNNLSEVELNNWDKYNCIFLAKRFQAGLSEEPQMKSFVLSLMNFTNFVAGLISVEQALKFEQSSWSYNKTKNKYLKEILSKQLITPIEKAIAQSVQFTTNVTVEFVKKSKRCSSEIDTRNLLSWILDYDKTNFIFYCNPKDVSDLRNTLDLNVENILTSEDIDNISFCGKKIYEKAAQ